MWNCYTIIMNLSNKAESKQATKTKYFDLGFAKIPKSTLRIIEKLLILIVMALAVFYLLPRLSSIEESLLILRSLKSWAVILAVATQILRSWGNGLIINECTKLTKHKVSSFHGSLISMASYSFGLVAGGMFGTAATTYRWVKTNGGDSEGASLAFTVPPVFIDIALAVFSVFGLCFLFFINSLTTFEVVSYILISLLLAAIFIVFLLSIRYEEKFIQICIKILSALFKVFKKDLPVEGVRDYLRQSLSTCDFLIKEGWKRPMWASFLAVIFDMGTIYFLFMASGNPISLIYLITGYGLPILFGRMAFMFPGGIGVIESMMIAAYTNLGIDNSLATVVVLAYRVLSFWLPVVFGFLLIPYLDKTSNKKNEISA